MSTKVVKSLITEGLLATVSARNPVRRQSQRVVTPHALAEFEARYVSLHALAKERGKSMPHLKRELAAMGVCPVGDPASLHLTLYQRADIP